MRVYVHFYGAIGPVPRPDVRFNARRVGAPQ